MGRERKQGYNEGWPEVVMWRILFAQDVGVGSKNFYKNYIESCKISKFQRKFLKFTRGFAQSVEDIKIYVLL